MHAALGNRQMNLISNLFKNKITLIGLAFMSIVIGMALFSPWVAPHDPIKHNLINRYADPSWQNIGGTDQYGRDVLSRTIWGSRTSLAVGLLATALAAVFGTTLGLIAGYTTGFVSKFIMWFTDIFMSFPTMVLAVIIVVAFGAGTQNVIFALGIAFIPRYIRLSRATTLSAAQQVYIEASRATGQSHSKIIFKHILPNIAGDIIVMSTLWIATAIRLEASLSFLGLGTQPPTPSWGMMVREGMDFFLGYPWLALIPGGGIFLATMGFNIIGDGMRDALDPKLRGRLL